ncbi:hypothetical protein F5148DRAFT_1366860 [Russula earlei]|uniref:Uncharacterized protein n=1 Tax=Russula earlei TaxID=71964 RepID=A0ACC0UEE0_9AGAM|nr:hypothetical protein F5148DRAFT_1366860 [Russula earlei]
MHARSVFVVLCLAFGIPPSLALPCGVSSGRAERPSPKCCGAGPSEGQKGPSLAPTQRRHKKRMDPPESGQQRVWTSEQGGLKIYMPNHFRVTEVSSAASPGFVPQPSTINVHVRENNGRQYVMHQSPHPTQNKNTNTPKTTTSLREPYTSPPTEYMSPAALDSLANEWLRRERKKNMHGPNRSPSVFSSERDRPPRQRDGSVRQGAAKIWDHNIQFLKCQFLGADMGAKL